MFRTTIAAAAAAAASSSVRADLTVTGKALVVLTPLRVRVAVRVAVALGFRGCGRVTTPAAVITAGLLVAQVMADPLAPVDGKVRFVVRAETSPRSMACASAVRPAVTTGSARVVTSVGLSA